jgi:hypothetical protein
MDRNQIIKTIDDYAAQTGLQQSTICQYAVQNRKAYDRLRSGSLSMLTAEKIVEWIRENPASARASQ